MKKSRLFKLTTLEKRTSLLLGGHTATTNYVLCTLFSPLFLFMTVSFPMFDISPTDFPRNKSTAINPPRTTVLHFAINSTKKASLTHYPNGVENRRRNFNSFSRIITQKFHFHNKLWLCSSSRIKTNVEGTILNDRFINERDPFVSEFRFDPRRWNVHCSR